MQRCCRNPPIAAGRKNWLFCAARTGAGVIVFAVPETVEADGLNPEADPKHLLAVLSERFAAVRRLCLTI